MIIVVKMKPLNNCMCVLGGSVERKHMHEQELLRRTVPGDNWGSAEA